MNTTPLEKWYGEFCDDINSFQKQWVDFFNRVACWLLFLMLAASALTWSVKLWL